MAPSKAQIAFAEQVELICEQLRVDIIDGAIVWCSRNNYDVEYAATMIKKNPVLLAKMTSAAEAVNAIKKTATLPV